MPLYDYECSKCGEIKDIWAKIDETDLFCACGLPMRRLISPTGGICDLKPYFDENLGDKNSPGGRWVESRQHRRRLMKEQGLMEAG